MRKTLTNYVNKQAIREVLGCFIQQPKLLKEYKTCKSDFPETFHQLIFAATNNLFKNGVDEIDAVSIDEYLSHYETQYKLFEKYNGTDFIGDIVELANPVNIKYYYEQLKKFSLLRRYVENGFDVSEFFDPHEIDPTTVENQREKLDESSVQDIINHFKKKHIEVTAPFSIGEGRDSKKAGTSGQEQKERWKKDTAWGIGYSSAYLTTALHGIRKRRFNIRSAGTGVGKTRLAIADICNACCPYLYDKKLKKWIQNPNGIHNGGLYIGTEMELLEEIDPILWAYIADVPQEHIEFNMYKDDEEERVDEAIRILEEEANIWLEYLPQYDGNMLEDVIEEHKINHGIKYVWFDYIHITVELISEFSAQSKAKMTIREDQVLAGLSNVLKRLTRKFDISLDTGTQISGEFKNESNRDQTIVRGAKSIIDKADGAMIAMPPTEKELKKIEPILRQMMNAPVPNLILSLYKNRGGKWNKIKIWLYVDYSTMRTQDLFVTDYEYRLDGEKVKGIEKTFINVEEDATDNKPIIIERKEVKNKKDDLNLYF